MHCTDCVTPKGVLSVNGELEKVFSANDAIPYQSLSVAATYSDGPSIYD